MDCNLDSIYDLITKLCEKYASLNQNSGRSGENIKKLRKKCYEILLSRNTSSVDSLELEGNNDPVCHLLAWEYILKSDYSLTDQARKIRNCCEKLENLNVFDDQVNCNIMMCLLHLRSVPKGDDSIMEKSLNRELEGKFSKPLLFPAFDNSKFHLSDDELLYGIPGYDSDMFKMGNRRVVYRTSHHKSANDFISHKKVQEAIKCAEEMNISDQNLNIWEVASRSPPSAQRTWEEFGYSCTKREFPFLCESIPETTAWVCKLSSQVERWGTPKPDARNVLTSQRFVRDIKYLLVGIEAKSFLVKADGEMMIKPGISVEGLSPGALKSYSDDLVFCSRCYKGLDALCSQNPFTLKETNNGYIFFELCESIKRYLSYYRLAILSIPNSFNLLMLHQHTRQLRKYVTALASICKVGPYKKSMTIPHGVALLNYLFQQVMSLTDTNLIMVLYSILYPCCQVYFSRFLQQWLLHGSIHDPYGEFFINVHPKYITTRGRTYWTRSYTLRHDIVPDFIENLTTDVLLCGKAMNLLKLCVPNSPLCMYIMEKRPEIISCCLMADQLSVAERNNYSYYLEATAVCGPRVSLSQVINLSREKNHTYLNLIAKKRVATLSRIELERRQESEKEIERRQSEMKVLQDEYTEAMREKQTKRADELDANMKMLRQNIWIENLYNKIIEEESNDLIQYYNKLYEASEVRRLHFEKRSQNLRKILDLGNPPAPKCEKVEVEDTLEEKSTPDDSDTYLSTHEEVAESSSDYVLARSDGSLLEPNLNDINANSVQTSEPKEAEETNTVKSIANENFEIAKRNKAKVMAVEMNIITGPLLPEKKTVESGTTQLTEAQRNKLKVLSSEFGIELPTVNNRNISAPLSSLELNRNRMMISSDCFSNTNYLNEQQKILFGSICDNENFLNKNIDTDNGNESNMTKRWANKKQEKLCLDFSKLNSKSDTTLLKAKVSETKPCKSPKFELDKVSPMSIDSTPLSSSVTTPSRSTINFDRPEIDTCETATATDFDADFDTQGFSFEFVKQDQAIYFENRKSAFNLHNEVESRVLKKSISNKDAKAVSTNCLKLYLQQSILFPLSAQLKLVTNELLKFFINDQQYLKHLTSLRNFFFLLDGEFGRNITENLFIRLYDVNFPIDLINVHTLTVLVYKALDYSTKLQNNSQFLSFRINALPQVFDLGDPDVFDCISLTYKTSWPLNILLPSDTIAKYDEVFKFLLKLHRISWVLQNVFQDLKTLLKETESRNLVLMTSPQYRKLHQCRHIMTHFIQTLQNYILGEVLFSSWEIFENHLQSVTNIDQLYALHTSYIKNIHFMCLLKQKSAPIQKVLHKIFIVILKFYDYLRSRSWISVKGVFMHPNFKKLEDIFLNFQELVLYFFKIGDKVVRCGYQPHLLQLLNMLNINHYYNKVQ
uniref:Gamma-tubulin complex component 6 n=2 Tax=Photinus pyralis TaxID=7054 RepID=A0A1Y1L2S9_PHOPY